jgi:ketosteroid isomerase-like protein
MPLTQHEVDEVRAAVAAVMACYDALDADGLIGMCTDDFTIVRPETGAERARSRESLSELFSTSMNAFESMETEYDLPEVDGDGDIAYALFRNSDRYTLAEGGESVVLDDCQTLMVFRRHSDGSWRMKLQMCVLPSLDATESAADAGSSS